jgi:hypothetical protein
MAWTAQPLVTIELSTRLRWRFTSKRTDTKLIRCAIHTRRSIEAGVDQDINSLELRALVELRASRVHERSALLHRIHARLDEWPPDLTRLFEDLMQRRHWLGALAG